MKSLGRKQEKLCFSSILTKMFAFSINCHRNGFFFTEIVLAAGKRAHKYTFAYILGSAKHIVM